MRIIAANKVKIKFMMTVSLVAILGVIAAGTYLIERFNTVETLSTNIKNMTVIVDAGHGGVDGGTQAADGTLEKDLNLQIALKVNNFLTSFGVNTVMTRESDISIHDSTANTIREKKVSDIKNRLNIIETTENSLFVSIHQNYFSQSKYTGTQVFYSGNNPQSSILADSIRESVIAALQPDNSRELKKSGTEIYLLYHAQAPAVMVECGFLSNSQEAEMLKNEDYQNKLAYFISMGILNYLKTTEAV